MDRSQECYPVSGVLLHPAIFLIQDMQLNSFYNFRLPELRNVFSALTKLLTEEKYIFHPFEVMPNGLAGVDDGWTRSKKGQVRSFYCFEHLRKISQTTPLTFFCSTLKVSATKLVFRISETPSL